MRTLPRTDAGVRGGLAGPVVALWAGLRLGWAIGFRVRGRYAAWRWETAFGRGTPKGWELVRSLYDYLLWSARMRRAK
ncbi:MAG: hypothetical protein RBS39_01795 [Phycisphaerales bacterium]|nr:hypothetical protein [Phycisphaerales bacterium]